MADTPQKPVAATRPLSPHLTIYRWPVTMATSIIHRATGVGLAIGAVVLAWWLVSISNGPDGYGRPFMAMSDTPIGLMIVFGLTWSIVYHFLNGIRHLAWDLGYGFPKQVAERNSAIYPCAFHHRRDRYFRACLDRSRRISAMKSAQTPLHKVEGMGSSHSGTGHFWHERVTAVALIPLSLWFLYVMLGLAGTSEVAALQFLAHPWNALLMARLCQLSRFITPTWACRW